MRTAFEEKMNFRLEKEYKLGFVRMSPWLPLWGSWRAQHD